jgi:hypothetical protein
VKRILSLVVALALVLLMAPEAQAYRLIPRAHATASATYERDASYNAKGAAWIADADTADANWGSYFNFVHGSSSNKLRAVAMGSTAALAVTIIPIIGR